MDLYNENDKKVIRIYDALKQVFDPELGINIIDMGLVYGVSFKEEEGIIIKMTLSSKGCPMGDAIINKMASVLNEDFPECRNSIELVWEPKWSTNFISSQGKNELGFI